MPTTLSPVSVANVALSKIGNQAITSLNDTANAAAIVCLNNFNLAYEETSRAGKWNCLLATAILTEIPQTPLPWSSAGQATTITATAWLPNHAYLANVYVTFGGYFYQVAFNYTSTASFINDLTTGALVQTDTPTSGNTFGLGDGSQYPSGWAHQYALPTGFMLLAALNDTMCWDLDGAGGDDYEIMGSSLFSNASNAVVQYVPDQPDCTQWDPMFTNAVTLKLASAIATTLRQDGGKMQAEMLQAYDKAIRNARTRNGGEQQARRANLIRSSRFNAARYGGLNG